MYVVEKETGLFSSFNVPSNSFDISRLEFTLTTLKIPHENLTLLSLINYDQKPLKSLKSDTVLTANYAFILP
jgi:hypothetical protein